MKKIVLSFVCCMFLLTGCSTEKVKLISISELVEKIENKDSFVLIVSRNSCAHCQKLEEMLEETTGDHSTIIYNVKLDETSYDTLVKDAKELEKYVSEPGTTPHIYSMKDGKEADGYEGFSESQPNEFWDFIKKNNLENAK